MRFRFGSGSSSESSRGSLIVPIVFLGAGLWALYEAYSVYVTTALATHAGIFLAAGAGLISVSWASFRKVRSARAHASRVEALRDEHPGEPWMVRPEWHDSRFEEEAPRDAGIMWMAIIWNLIAWPIAFAAIRQELLSPEPDRAVVMVLLFPLMGVVLGGVALRQFLRRRKFGRTVLQLDTMPVPLGGSLRARFETNIPARDPPPEGFHVMLSCYRRKVVQSSSSSGSSTSVELKLCWRDEKRMRGIPFDAGTRLAVPVSFDVPHDQPQSTAERTGNRILWRIEVEAEVPGVNFQSQVEIPVFDLEQSAPLDAEPGRLSAGAWGGDGARISGDDDEDFSTHEIGHILSTPRSPGIELRTPSPGRIEFFFDRARDKSSLAVTTVVFLVCFGLAVALSIFGEGAPFGVLLMLGVVGASFGYVGYREWAYTSTLTVDAERLEFVRGPFGRGEPVVIPAAELTDVRLEIGATSNVGSVTRASYWLVLVRKASEEARISHAEQLERLQSLADTLGLRSNDGTAMSDILDRAPPLRPTVKVCGGLKDKKEADWIALKIMEAAVGQGWRA
jgi:hypothetical protein